MFSVRGFLLFVDNGVRVIATINVQDRMPDCSCAAAGEAQETQERPGRWCPWVEISSAQISFSDVASIFIGGSATGSAARASTCCRGSATRPCPNDEMVPGPCLLQRRRRMDRSGDCVAVHVLCYVICSICS